MDLISIEMAFSVVVALIPAVATFGALRFQIAENTKDIKDQQQMINRLLATNEKYMNRTDINASDILNIKTVQAEERENIKLLQSSLQDLKFIVIQLKTIVEQLNK